MVSTVIKSYSNMTESIAAYLSPQLDSRQSCYRKYSSNPPPRPAWTPSSSKTCASSTSRIRASSQNWTSSRPSPSAGSLSTPTYPSLHPGHRLALAQVRLGRWQSPLQEVHIITPLQGGINLIQRQPTQIQSPEEALATAPPGECR